MSPYRTPSPPAPVVRPLAWLARLVPAPLRPHAQGWQWYRRAIGGRWRLVVALLVPGCPECWIGGDTAPGYSHLTAAAEHWP